MDEKSLKDRKPGEPRNESNKVAVDKDAAGKDASRKADDKPSPKPTATKPASLAGLSSFEQLAQRKEVRIGMAVLAVLILVLGYVFVSKISEADPNQAASADASPASDGQQPTDSSDQNPPPTVVTATPNDYSTGHSPTTAPGHQGVYASEAPPHDAGPPSNSYLPNRSAHDHADGNSAHHAATAGPTAEQQRDPTHDAGDKYSKYLTSPPPESPSGATAEPAASPSADQVADVPASDVVAPQGNHAAANAAHDENTDAAANGVGSRYVDNGQPGAGIKTVPLAPTEVAADEAPHHHDQTDASPIADTRMHDNAAIARTPDVAATQANEIPESHVADVDAAHANTTTTQPKHPAPQHHAPAAPDSVAEAAPAQQPAAAGQHVATDEHASDDRAADNSVAARPQPEPANRTYVTLDGDSAATIAKRVYGDAALGAALLAFNGADLPADEPLAAGGEVLIPQRQILAQAFPQLMPRVAQTPETTAPRTIAPKRPTTPAAEQDVPAVAVADNVPPAEQRRADASNSRIYEVARGETVYDIARKELGRVSRWREILELNAEQLGGDIDAIEPGMKLRLPEEGRSAVARQRGELLWR